jgi:hypothetical protein
MPLVGNRGRGKRLEYQQIKEIVNRMNEHTVLEYHPQEVVTDLVENFFFKKYTSENLLETPVKDVETAVKKLYLNTFPKADKDLLQSFADDVVFYMAFRLTKQGGFGPLR